MSPRIPAPVREQIITLLKAQVLPSVITKQLKVGHGTVYNIARDEGIAFKRSSAGDKRAANMAAKQRVTKPVEGQNWRGAAYSLRGWGRSGGFGGGWI